MISPVKMSKKCKREDRCRTYSERNDSAKRVYKWVVRWPIGSASVSHQCGPGSIPGWGSDPGAVSEKVCSCLSYPPSLGGDVKPLT